MTDFMDVVNWLASLHGIFMGGCLDRDLKVQYACIFLIRHILKIGNAILEISFLFGSIMRKNTCCFLLSLHFFLDFLGPFYVLFWERRV
jgi:hypothetical protein